MKYQQLGRYRTGTRNGVAVKLCGRALVIRPFAMALASLVLAATAITQPVQGQTGPALTQTGPLLTQNGPPLIQNDPPLLQRTGSIVGTVTDVNGDLIALARVVLEGPRDTDRRAVQTNENGFFEFREVEPADGYRVSVSGEGFAEWRSAAVTLAPNESKILTGIRLMVAPARTTIRVTANPEQVATEEVKQEERQRIFGILPNFYVVYYPDAVALTARLKFHLALKLAGDPVTFLGLAFVAGVQQAGDSPNYGQGVQGYAKRFGANAGDALTDIMIGNAILPSLLHQDPRYFYQGTGTNRSRLRHAILSTFICRGDDGKPQPDFSGAGGDLASAAISNAYYPASSRGAQTTFTNFGINTAARVVTNLAQEFLLHRVTRKPSSSQ